MPNPPKTVILRARVDQPLYDALLCSARAQGIPVADLVRDTLSAAHDRRARVCSSLGLARDASDAKIFAALQPALIELSPVEQETARGITDVGHALGFAAARAAKKRASKPSPSASSKPAPRPSAAPKQRSAKLHLITADQYDQLLAVRARRAGKPAPPKGASEGRSVTVSASDLAELKRGIK